LSYRILEWDSQFFGLRVAQVVVDPTTDGAGLSECLRKCGADLTYVFVPFPSAPMFRAVLEKHAGKCYDHKRTYSKLVNPVVRADDVSAVTVTGETEELLRLAYASGHLSRFYLDPLLKPCFQKLYHEWVRKALQDVDSKVIALMEAGRMAGMVTASVTEGVGKIGLLAVDERCRGRGLGQQLLSQCEVFYRSRGVEICKVVTQKDNASACRLYEKQGYKVERDVDVWHVWK
jgi:dTDP-4-amino-4,6-dideoxy-D-galactose acyltransferase